MSTLVDTSVWSLALRRPQHALNYLERRFAAELRLLVTDARVRIIGSIRQEVLTGIRHPEQFQKLRSYLAGFADYQPETADYEVAAEFANRCTAKGISGSPVDFLICAVSVTRDWTIFTRDSDFRHYARVLPLQFHSIRPTIQ